MGTREPGDDDESLYGPGRFERLTRMTPERARVRAELARRAAEREPSKLSLTDPATEQRLHELLARHIASDRIEAVLHTPAPGLGGMTLLEYAGLNGLPAAAAKIEQMFDWSRANGA